jgi:hypothetical protein
VTAVVAIATRSTTTSMTVTTAVMLAVVIAIKEDRISVESRGNLAATAGTAAITHITATHPIASNSNIAVAPVGIASR